MKLDSIETHLPNDPCVCLTCITSLENTKRPNQSLPRKFMPTYPLTKLTPEPKILKNSGLFELFSLSFEKLKVQW